MKRRYLFKDGRVIEASTLHSLLTESTHESSEAVVLLTAQAAMETVEREDDDDESTEER